jgi:hypothetical protein
MKEGGKTKKSWVVACCGVAGGGRTAPAKGGREGESREGRERIGGEEREKWFPKMETLKSDIAQNRNFPKIPF